MAPLFTGNWFGFGRNPAGQASGVPSPNASATGGTKTTSGEYTVHTFNYPQSDPGFVISDVGDQEWEYIIVAGGGGGAQDTAGGGGAGGVVYGTMTGTELTAQTYPVTVGIGGDKRKSNSHAQKGGNSLFGSPQKLIAYGGGGGGGWDHDPGGINKDGGCGAGTGPGSGGEASQPGANQGVPGPMFTQSGADGANGDDPGPNGQGGGGGGGQSAGGGGGDGGTGITWNGTVYAGGGSGANANNQQNNPGGSPGGGGITNTSPGNVSRAGIDGRGGGGAAGFGGWGAGGPGGAGVFIIRYK